MALTGHSGSWGKLICETNEISCQTPFESRIEFLYCTLPYTRACDSGPF
jgi:hypothetical protein